MTKHTMGLGIALVLGAATAAAGQTGLPTTQPNLLQITREEIKVGHAVDHEKTEAGWPAAFEKAKSPYYYIALASTTGLQEVWFVSPYESHKAMGESTKMERDNAVLAAELARLQRADAEHLGGLRTILAMARKDLSHGNFPEVGKQRFYEITTFRMRPGREGAFEAAAKAYAGAVGRASAGTSFRVYQVMAGMPTPTFLIFSSVTSMEGFDTGMTDDQAIMKAFNEADQKAFQQFFDGVVSSDSQRFALSPTMSYVPAETRASDPAFWMPKKPVTKSSTAPQTKPRAEAGAKPESR